MVSKENSTKYIKVLKKCMHNFCQESMLEAQKGDFSLKEMYGWGRWLYCFPPKFFDPPRLPVWRHIVTGKSLGSLVQISKGYDSYLDERGPGKAKKLANIAIYR